VLYSLQTGGHCCEGSLIFKWTTWCHSPGPQCICALTLVLVGGVGVLVSASFIWPNQSTSLLQQCITFFQCHYVTVVWIKLLM
jgi:hypothetical protein